MSGKRSYLPDTGSYAPNNKRIPGAPTARRRIRGRETNKKKRKSRGRKGRREGRLVEGYDGLGLVQLFDVGRERVPCTSHPINLDLQFQIRFSLSLSLSLSLSSLQLSPLNGAQP